MQGGNKMKTRKNLILTIVLVLAVIVGGYTLLPGTNMAAACGWGNSGGGDYVPQERDASNNFLAQKPALTETQAQDIVSNYVKRLNPELEIGTVTDNGSFYEAQIISAEKEVVQLLGVDKQSGRLIVLK